MNSENHDQNNIAIQDNLETKSSNSLQPNSSNSSK